ncbi:MAG TPA: SDR family oxidoreductase [Burkholderiales bacterium]|jgi:NAD(P)-dependent dehydrogenase (short-subunit alcohol dehydrogenase family)|nr:SDR family oxidoreductase [Burkholderiales bacterium]
MNETPGYGRAALVTGAARRIGRAIALGLAEDGWDVAVHYHHSRDEAQALVRALRAQGAHAMAIDCDLGDPKAVLQLVPECARRLGPLSLLVNNASVFEYDDVDAFDVQQWDRHQAVNLRAPIVLARALARQLPPDTVGCVINLLDQKVFNLNPDFLSYTLSKIALEGATRLLALALAPRVRVCGIAPGITLRSGQQTDENFQRAHRLAPLGRSSEPADIVQAVRYAVAAGALTGTTIVVDGGQHLWPSRRDVQFEAK